MHNLLTERPKPTLEAQHLQILSEEASPDIAETFAADYATLLPRRVQRIVHAVNLRDRDMARDASLSLKTASWLAGALRMTQLCRELELALAVADWAAAAAVAQNIELHQQCLQDALASRPRPALAEPSLQAFPR
ncbi:hypothetical protein [Arthrobacter sp. ISL-65]|uniref:hypothetical protein n=1 Tax=Arthrobacter sp. ISL-65 TaxID=2819112 RepID=UPI001BEAC21F|nr:hypothetical protein [Arthrobacter sp. ISL-65]MBT2549727.1 hypothetical protein [Arthrobacter sp. ISL-65]